MHSHHKPSSVTTTNKSNKAFDAHSASKTRNNNNNNNRALRVSHSLSNNGSLRRLYTVSFLLLLVLSTIVSIQLTRQTQTDLFSNTFLWTSSSFASLADTGNTTTTMTSPRTMSESSKNNKYDHNNIKNTQTEAPTTTNDTFGPPPSLSSRNTASTASTSSNTSNISNTRTVGVASSTKLTRTSNRTNLQSSSSSSSSSLIQQGKDNESSTSRTDGRSSSTRSSSMISFQTQRPKKDPTKHAHAITRKSPVHVASSAIHHDSRKNWKNSNLIGRTAATLDGVTTNYSETVLLAHPVDKWLAGELPEVAKFRVLLWPYIERGVSSAEAQHIYLDGINGSDFLELGTDLDDFDPSVIWLVYTGPKWCILATDLAEQAVRRRAAKGLPLQWPIYISDYSDYVGFHRCKSIEDVVSAPFVRRNVRSRTGWRWFDEEKKWVTKGQLETLVQENITYRHTPFSVRTDVVSMIAQQLRLLHNKSLDEPLEEMNRTVDVAHFWPLDLEGVRRTAGELRTRVSGVIAQLAQDFNLTVHVKLAGNAARKGRRGVAPAYASTMLECKIIVVAQRDPYEDHYRLFEALVSGAMVMTDRMLSLPEGLQNGTSIVEYSSAQELQSQILYYLNHSKKRLDIAREGRRIAMSRHRSWHRVEDIIFGKPLTTCNTNTTTRESGPCPYIVHTSNA